MEITQGIQGHPYLEDDTVPLIAGRSTTFRVFVEPNLCVSPIYVYIQSSEGQIEAVADNTPRLPPTSPKRKNEDDTFNLTFANPPVANGVKYEAVASYVPPQWAHNHPPFGDCTGPGGAGNHILLRAATALLGGLQGRLGLTSTSCLEKTVDFIERRQPVFEAFPVHYQYGPWEGDRLPNDDLAESGADMMWAGWPIPDSGGGSYTYFPSLPIVTPEDFRIKAVGNFLLFLDRLDERRCIEGRADYIHAWTPNGVFDGGHAGDRSTLGDATPNLHRATYAHELGHIIGPFEGGSHPELPTSNQVGWDVLARMADIYPEPHVRDGNELDDLMMLGASNEGNLMVPRQRYETVIENLPAYAPDFEICRPSQDVEAQMYRLVSGYTQNDAPITGTLRSAAPLTGTVTTSPILGGNSQIRLFDSTSALQYETTFDRDSYGMSTFMRSVPMFSDTQRVELHSDSVLLDVITRTLNSPALTVISPQPNSTMTDTLIVKWIGSDADEDPLTARVLYSHNGTAWHSLSSVGYTDTLAIATEGLGSSTGAVVRITLHDGFNATTVDVKGLTLLPNRIPLARIKSPQTSITIPFGVNLSLLGSAYDPEDGNLEGSSITWRSSLDGYLGAGDAINVGGHAGGCCSNALSQGTHLILFEATDLNGAKGTDSVTVIVE